MEGEDFEVLLIDLVKDHSIIYDKKVDGYRNKNAKARVWEEIGGKLSKTAQECLQLWNSLRSQYMAHKRKLSKPSGSGGGNRPYFRHELNLQFLNDGEPLDSTYSNVENDRVDEENYTDVDLELQNLLNTSQNEQENRLTTENLNPEGPRQVRQLPDHRLHRKYIDKKRKLDPVDEEMIKLLKTEDDEFTNVGNLIAAKLRLISKSDRKVYLETEHFIHTLLHEAEMKIITGEID